MQSKPLHAAPDDTRLAELAAIHHGVVGYRQLLELGYSRHAITRRAATGRLHRIHRGVYAVGHPKLSLTGRWMAAVLACGGGPRPAVLSHHDAATLHDLRRVGSGQIHVTATSRHNIAGIHCHYVRALDAEDRVVVDGIPVTGVERTLLDLAEILSRQRLRTMLEQTQRQDKLNLEALDAVIARNRGRRGIKPLGEAMNELTDEPAWTQSELEDRFRELVRNHDLPVPRTNVFVEGELVDAVWPEHNVVVEVDGWKFHRSKRSFEDDRRRDAKLVVCGWRVVRFTDKRVRQEPAAVARELSELLRAAPSPRPARSGR